MKIWIDDQIDDKDTPHRHVPQGWIGAKTALQACRYIKTGKVTDIDFDHDLGTDTNDRGGYIVALYIEKLAYNKMIPALQWRIHSANPVGRKNITQAMQSAERFWNG